MKELFYSLENKQKSAWERNTKCAVNQYLHCAPGFGVPHCATFQFAHSASDFASFP